VSLWLCLRFHRLPLEVLTRQRPGNGKPCAVLEKQRVLQACDTATELGIAPGMSTATARALADSLQLLERDPATERQGLQQLCCWAYSVTPSLHPYRENCLLLEVGGSLALFHGLDPLLAKVRSELHSRGYSYHSALAATPGAAWLLSHGEQDDAGRRGDGDDLAVRLAPLPLALLDEFPRQVASLAKAGLWNFGDILSLPRQALGRRCGREFVRRLQQLLGTEEDRQPEYRPPVEFSDDYWFGYEVRANQELLPAVQLLLQSLCQFLRNTQLQGQQVEWQLYGINREIRRLQVHCSLSQATWQEWYQLTGLKLEQLQLDIGIEGVGLHCSGLQPGNAACRDLFSPAEQREPLHSLLDRLQNRLGLQSVEKIACRDEHLPEFAGFTNCDIQRDDGTTVAADYQRPFWLMPEPQRLRRSRQHLHWNGRLTIAAGPERIEDNWWHDAASRDYYIAHDTLGQQYWVYLDRLQQDWFIQGIFA
jgi:protein ImuB